MRCFDSGDDVLCAPCGKSRYLIGGFVLKLFEILVGQRNVGWCGADNSINGCYDGDARLFVSAALTIAVPRWTCDEFREDVTPQLLLEHTVSRTGLSDRFHNPTD
jgi:hypothetical protein